MAYEILKTTFNYSDYRDPVVFLPQRRKISRGKENNQLRRPDLPPCFFAWTLCTVLFTRLQVGLDTKTP